MSVTIYQVTCHLGEWIFILWKLWEHHISQMWWNIERWGVTWLFLRVLDHVPVINICIFKWMQLLPIGLQVVQHGTMRCNLMVTVIIIILPLNIRSSWSVNHPFTESLFKHIILFIIELSCHVRTMIILRWSFPVRAIIHCSLVICVA